MNPEEEKKRANDAERLLRELQPHITAMRAQLLLGFESSKYDQSEERDEIWRQYRSIKALEQNLSSIITTGKMSTITLNGQ
jgi:hypothetical protein